MMDLAQQISETIRSIVADVLFLDPTEVHEDATVDSLPDWDSMAMVQIVMKVEESLSVRIDYAEVAEIRGIADLVAAATPS
jgi:acyl carrier protein